MYHATKKLRNFVFVFLHFVFGFVCICAIQLHNVSGDRSEHKCPSDSNRDQSCFLKVAFLDQAIEAFQSLMVYGKVKVICKLI